MDDIAKGVLAFIRSTDEHPLPPSVRTRDVLNALRAHLDATVSGWREKVFEPGEEQKAVEVQLRLQSGRVVQGALHQRASAA